MASPELKRLVDAAKRDRCLLPDKWEEGAVLSGRDQRDLAKALLAIKPVTVERGGRRVPCEPAFTVGRKERTRIVVAMLRDGEGDAFIRANVPGPNMGAATLAKIKAEADRVGVTGPPAFFDATSGANPEAHRRLLAILAG